MHLQGGCLEAMICKILFLGAQNVISFEWSPSLIHFQDWLPFESCCQVQQSNLTRSWFKCAVEKVSMTRPSSMFILINTAPAVNVSFTSPLCSLLFRRQSIGMAVSLDELLWHVFNYFVIVPKTRRVSPQCNYANESHVVSMPRR